jgi:hypothetical protein
MKKINQIILLSIIVLVISTNAEAQTSTITFPVIDQLMCGFIIYSKSKLVPYIAVLCVVISVIGHWLGMTKIWGALLYISMGLGLVMGIGSVISGVTGSAASCIAY